MKRIKLPLISTQPLNSSKSKSALASIKNDCKLFPRLYIGCEACGGNIDDFFCHENQAWPPSLSEQDSIRFGNKSDIITCIESSIPQLRDPPNNFNSIILDGAVIVHLVRPIDGIKTFKDYAETGRKPIHTVQIH